MSQHIKLLALSALLLSLCACRASGSIETRRAVQAGDSGAWMAVDTATGSSVSLDVMAAQLAKCDVVFLGEEHDKTVAHQLQMELTRRIVELRPNATLSFEMIERDAQEDLDRYLAGGIDESSFLKDTRPWPNYARDYRPMVEFARERGLPVIAANVPRPLASRVSKEGLEPVADEAFMPRTVLAPPGEYQRRFAVAMGNTHDTVDPKLERWFLAQVVKDEAMAESIERGLCAPPAGRIVLHYCGKFHSDYGLGTVERLRRRQPSLRIGVVTTLTADRDPARIDEQLARAADYVWLVAK